MSYPETVCHWIKEVAMRFPHLSWSQAKVLACYSLGIVVAGTCGLTQVSDSLAEVLGQTQPTVFQRLREWRNEASAKRGSHRQQVDVSACFAPLLTWILSCWDPSSHRLVLVVDATNVSDRFVILSISVVLRSCAIPVAWHIVPAGVKGGHKSHWLHLLECLRGAVPAEWEVLVMADRGLYARWLYRTIVACGWHPFLRIRSGCNARPASSHRVGDFREIKTLVPRAGTQWSGDVMCFSDRHSRLCCRLLARWDEGYEEPWFVVTDLPSEEAQACWYGLRSWIECGFKDGKRGGWNWQRCRCEIPSRVERIWLAMAVATLLTVGMGAQREVQEQAPCLERLPPTHIARRTAKPERKQHQRRKLSCFNRGCRLAARLIWRLQEPLRFFLPVEPWPHEPDLPLAEGFFNSG